MQLDSSGRIENIRFIASPNFDERPKGNNIELLVIHNISLPPGQFGGDGIIQLFTNQLNPQEHSYYKEICDLRVSAHFLIRRTGELIQFVSCNQRAWHAGTSAWDGRERCNDFSIGIELEGADDLAFEDAQYKTLIPITQLLLNHYPIKHLVGHSDIAPGRKTDPGPNFDWQRYRTALSMP